MSAIIVESREWYLAAYAPEGIPTSDHLKIRCLSLALDAIPEQHVVLETLFVSVEPYLRGRMTGLEEGLYFAQFNLNEVVSAFGVGRVIMSKDSDYGEVDMVICPSTSFAEYCVVSSQNLRKVEPNAGIPLPEYLGLLGIPGLAAWVGIEVIAEPIKAGSNVFISAAASAVGTEMPGSLSLPATREPNRTTRNAVRSRTRSVTPAIPYLLSGPIFCISSGALVSGLRPLLDFCNRLIGWAVHLFFFL